jgi:hypothetical protein
MQLCDVVKVVGTSQLKDFPWGALVVDLMNSFLVEDQMLTLQSDGEALSAAIGSLAQEQQMFLLAATVDTKRIKLTVPAQAPPDTPPLPDTIDVMKEKNNRLFNMGSLAFMALLTIAALLMFNDIHPEEKLTFENAKDYLLVLVDMFKAYLGLQSGS